MPKARVLVVDDQLYFRTFLEGLLSEEGYAVETAAGGAEALHILERDRFDVVVTDLVMPEMDGAELIRGMKERWPDQDVIIVSGVGDVQTAVEAMKYGADDYLLKPIERTALLRAVDNLLGARRLRVEHEKLMSENLEFMGVLGVYERALGLYGTLTLEPLAERTVEALCLETGAQSGVLWALADEGAEGFTLLAARGLVEVGDEPEALDLEALPPGFAGMTASGAGAQIAPDSRREGLNALVVPLRHAGRVLGVVRLSDRVEDAPFGDGERLVADKIAELASGAFGNALRVRTLERRSFRDPVTQAYTVAYFEDVVRNEIQKANRFGRSFGLLTLEVDPLEPLKRRLGEAELARWLEGVVFQVGRALRSTDLLAAESEHRFRILLPETDSLGAAVLKRRIREAILESDLLTPLAPAERPGLLAAAASYPADGSQVDALARALNERLEQDRQTLVRELEIEGESFAGAVDALLERAGPGHAQTPEQVMRFVVDEVGRRPRDRGLLFVAPGTAVPPPLREGLEGLRGLSPRTEIVLVGDGKPESLAGLPVTCVSARRAGTRAPFIVYFGEGPAYALVRDRNERSGSPPWFHTSDRPLVEHLAFQLQRDLGISLSV